MLQPYQPSMGFLLTLLKSSKHTPEAPGLCACGMAPGIEKRDIIIDCVEVQGQPTSSKTDTFGAGNLCLY